MGYGAYMNIVNNSSKPVAVSVSNQTCMYDNGADGSYLSNFNGITVPAFSKFPADGSTVYIEAKASGTCAFSNSEFSLGLGATTLNFSDTSSSWSVSTPPSTINVDINNSGSQGTIVITVRDAA